MARSLNVISLLLQSTTNCRYRVYTKFLLTYTAIYRRNRKVLPLGITALQPPSHFHLGTPYNHRTAGLPLFLLRYGFVKMSLPFYFSGFLHFYCLGFLMKSVQFVVIPDVPCTIFVNWAIYSAKNLYLIIFLT
jgi:hypothetical protein